jgi:hypothetical protein
LRPLQGISEKNRQKVIDGTRCMQFTVDLAIFATAWGALWSIENPWSSLMWGETGMIGLIKFTAAFWIYVDFCMYGSKYRKPTAILTTALCLDLLGRECDPQLKHKHLVLKGMIWCPVLNAQIFRTKLAQIYPPQFCSAFAVLIKPLLRIQDIVARVCSDRRGVHPKAITQFAESFKIKTPSGERKRELGSPLPAPDHRQRETGALAIATGYQMKKGIVGPILEVEMEPGQAIYKCLTVQHPFTRLPDLEPEIEANIVRALTDPKKEGSPRGEERALGEDRGGPRASINRRDRGYPRSVPAKTVPQEQDHASQPEEDR